VFSAPQRRRCLSLSPPWLRFSGTMKYAKGQWQKWDRAATQQAGAARGGPAPPMCVPALWFLSSPPFGFLSLVANYNFLVFFWNFLIFRNMVSWRSFFQQNPDSGSKSSNDHETCKNRGNNINIISNCEIYQWITVNYDTK
jgi:hypothetical protein